MENPSELLEKLESDPFILVKKPLKTTVRQNSLHSLVGDLHSEKLAGNGEIKTEATESAGCSILSGYPIERLANGAWLIDFNAEPENLVLEEGFQCKKRHVRIDPRFANDNTLKAMDGFTAAHYTERHEHSITKELIVVHVYIGRQASLTTWQVKRYQSGSCDDNKSEMEASACSGSLARNLEENVGPALELVRELVAEKCNRYKKALKKSYAIEAELKAASEKILTNSSAKVNNRAQLVTQYEELVASFGEEIAKINRYNDQEIDQRAERAEELSYYMKTTMIMRPLVVETHNQPQDAPSFLDDTDTAEINQIDIALEKSSLKPKSKKRNRITRS